MSRRASAAASRPARAALVVAAALLAGAVAFLITVNRTAVTGGAPRATPAVPLPSASTSPSLSPADWARAQLASTATIEALGGGDEGLGTGWLIDSKGDFVTNAHVIEGQLALRIRGRDGTSHVGDVLGSDRNLDIAVVRSRDGFNAPPFRPLSSPMPALPQPVVVLASSHATGHGDITAESATAVQADVPVTGDTITGRTPVTTDYHDMLVLDGQTIYPGNSGGPVLDSSGRVVGILTLASKSSAEAYAIQLSRVLTELLGFTLK